MSSIIWRGGKSSGTVRKGVRMQRIDGAYVYELGAKLRPILTTDEKHTQKIRLYHIVGPAVEAVRGFLFHSIYTQHARTVHASANVLLKSLEELIIDFNDSDTFEEGVSEWQIRRLKDNFKSFEAVLLAELQSFPMYMVVPKGGFDVSCLTDTAISLFPSSLSAKCPEAIEDVKMGAKSMAFELWTAMGFHFHRANEAVLRIYYKSVIGNNNKPKNLTMGTMVSSMSQHNVGDTNILAALKNIIQFHRNPIAHPDHTINDSDEALSLYAAVRACMGYMLDELPDPPIGGVGSLATQVIGKSQP